MKRFQTIAAYLVVLALSGVATLKSAEPGTVQGKAIVRSVQGTATYAINGTSFPLKVNKALDPGTTITTGPNSVVFLSINGLSSAVRVQADTTMAIPQMDRIGAVREGDTQTTLDLQNGSILGQVKKVTANSSYEIKTPHGVAGIRGTDFEVSVEKLENGPNGEPRYRVTFTSVKGQVIASAVVNGEIQTKTLHDGESWTPGEGDVHRALQSLLDEFATLINEMLTIVSVLPPGTILTVPIIQHTPPGQEASSNATGNPNGTTTGSGTGGGGGGSGSG